MNEPKKKIIIKKKTDTDKPEDKESAGKDSVSDTPTEDIKKTLGSESAPEKETQDRKGGDQKPEGSEKSQETQHEGAEDGGESGEEKTDADVQEKTSAGGDQDPEFKFFCVYCGQKLSSKVKMAGKEIDCPSCKRNLVIPSPPEK